jgi:hypothetical protein
LLLFFGGSLLPQVLGLMIDSVPKQQKAIASSITYLFNNLFGYLPAPFLYGAVSSIAEK